MNLPAAARGRFLPSTRPVEESDLAPWPNPDQLAALESPSATPANERVAAPPTVWAAAENRQRLWWWLLFIGGGALLAELAWPIELAR